MSAFESLQKLGWRPFFEAQIDATDTDVRPARVLSVHRDRVELAGEDRHEAVELSPKAAAMHITTGDWVLVDQQRHIVRRLDRFGAFRRRAAGTGADVQLIAANVDTLFIVTSANRDFNIARLERYLAIAHDAGAFPVIVITKADTVDSTEEYVAAASGLAPGVLVESLNALDPQDVDVLRPWCETGQTVALLGSSGVGKSTLTNTLTGKHLETQATREDDQRGRHTTTSRSMYALPHGGWLIDTPGMRELQLVNVGDALDDVFSEVTALAAECRFSDCAHESEPGCAVRSAIDEGRLDADRLRRYRKLQSEDRRNSESIAERRSRDKDFGKMIKTVMVGKRQQKGGKH